MMRVLLDIKQGYRKTFIAKICNGDNKVVFEYLKHGINPTKEYAGTKPIEYAIINDTWGYTAFNEIWGYIRKRFFRRV